MNMTNLVAYNVFMMHLLFPLYLWFDCSLLCTSLWIKASAKWLNVNALVMCFVALRRTEVWHALVLLLVVFYRVPLMQGNLSFRSILPQRLNFLIMTSCCCCSFKNQFSCLRVTLWFLPLASQAPWKGISLAAACRPEYSLSYWDHTQ